MNGKDFAIGVLSITAVILLASLVLVQTFTPNVAMAQQQTGAAGNYVVTTSRLDDNSEIVEIVDTTAQRMNIYGLNAGSGELVLIQQVDLRTRTGTR